MSEADFYAWWKVGYGIGVAVVLIVAVLLVTILTVARKIRSLAKIALATAGDILVRTRPIWSIAEANALTGEIVATVQSVDRAVAQVADALAPGGTKGGAS